jgi:hypothetical protein
MSLPPFPTDANFTLRHHWFAAHSELPFARIPAVPGHHGRNMP